jgi:TolA-binding protein
MLKGAGAMSAEKVQELEEMAARLRALARGLPPGQRRYDVTQQIRTFRERIASLEGQDLERQAPPKGEEMSERLRELEDMAATMVATARKLPPGPNRDNALQLIERFRLRIAALQ